MNCHKVHTYFVYFLQRKKEAIITMIGANLLHYLIFPHTDLMKQILILFSSYRGVNCVKYCFLFFNLSSPYFFIFYLGTWSLQIKAILISFPCS